MEQHTLGRHSISDVMPAYRDHGTGRRLRDTVAREQGWKQADRRAKWGSLQLAVQVSRLAGRSQNTAAEWPKFHREVPCFRSSTHPWRSWVFQPFVRPRVPCRELARMMWPPHHHLPVEPVKLWQIMFASQHEFRVAGRVKISSILDEDACLSLRCLY